MIAYLACSPSTQPLPHPLALPATCSAHGFLFDQAAFIAAYRRKAKVAAFLAQFRNSQMLEVFFTERLALAAGGYATDDPFERKVAVPAGFGCGGSWAGGGGRRAPDSGWQLALCGLHSIANFWTALLLTNFISGGRACSTPGWHGAHRWRGAGVRCSL